MTQGLADRPSPSDLNLIGGTLGIDKGGTGETTKTDAFDALAPATTKGDIFVFNGTNNIRLPVGTDNNVLTADAAEATGMKWAPVAAGAGGWVDDGTVVRLLTATDNVGIGMAAPSQKLEVKGNILAKDSTSLFIADRAAGTNFSGLQLFTGGVARWTIGSRNDSTENLHFFDEGSVSTRLFIDKTSGNVGIGTTSPDELTHFAKAVDGISVGLLLENSQANSAASINETAELRFGFGGNNDVARIVAGKEGDYTIVANEDSFLAFHVDQDGVSEEQVRIASGGKVGIRTSDPQYMLDMGGSTFVAIDGLFGHIIQHNNASAEFWTLATRNNGNFSIANTTSNPRPGGGVIAASNDKITIVPDGGVGIGGTPAANAILELDTTTKAFLPPRMTTTQRDAIASPTGGLVIYNSITNVLNFHNGTSWGAI